MSEPALANQAEARTEDGTIKDQSPTTTTETTKETTSTTPEKSSEKDPASTTPEPTKAKSLLTEKAEEPKGAPEKYEFTAPEGFEIDEAAVGKFTPLFKEMGLTQDQAQKLVNEYANVSKEAAEAPFKVWQDQQEAWRNEIKADPKLGGKLDSVRTTVSKFIDSIGDAKLVSDFKEAMDFTGAGNNPAFIRAFYALAQRFTEGTSVTGRGPSPLGQAAPGAKPTSAAKALYPNLP